MADPLTTQEATLYDKNDLPIDSVLDVSAVRRLAVDANINTNAHPIDIEESETAAIRNGLAYSVASLAPITLTAGATYDLLFKTGSATRIHLRDISVNVNKNNNSGIQKAAFYEGATITANGTQQTTFNNDRAIATASDMLVYAQCTHSVIGTKLYEYILHSDWETYLQPSYTTKFELILKKNTNYILRITNNQNQSIDFTWFIFYYQLEPY